MMLSPYFFGSMPVQPSTWFQQLEVPAENADFSYSAASSVFAGDAIANLTMAAAPSGIGEVVLSRLTLGQDPATGALTLVTVWVSGGVPGRTYLYRLNIVTVLGRTLSVYIGQTTDPVTAQCPLPPPPAPGFGATITWP